MTISRYGDLSPEDRARMAEGLHEMMQRIADDADERWLDARVPFPTLEELARQFARP
jgi:hypothetical protein